MIHPASERERWLRDDSAAAELLDLEGKARKTLYRIGDLRHRAAIQKELFNRERALLDIPDTIAFYDLTNVHGRADGKLPRFGRSKQKRNDCPTLALARRGLSAQLRGLAGQRERTGHAG